MMSVLCRMPTPTTHRTKSARVSAILISMFLTSRRTLSISLRTVSMSFCSRNSVSRNWLWVATSWRAVMLMAAVRCVDVGSISTRERFTHRAGSNSAA